MGWYYYVHRLSIYLNMTYNCVKQVISVRNLAKMQIKEGGNDVDLIWILAIGRCAGAVGAPGLPGGVRAGAAARAGRHQRAVLQPLRAAHGRQPRPHHGRRHRRAQAALRHMGQHRQRRLPHGEHRQSWMYSSNALFHAVLETSIISWFRFFQFFLVTITIIV